MPSTPGGAVDGGMVATAKVHDEGKNGGQSVLGVEIDLRTSGGFEDSPAELVNSRKRSKLW